MVTTSLPWLAPELLEAHHHPKMFDLIDSGVNQSVNSVRVRGYWVLVL